MTVEICCGSYLDALNAYKAGAKRIELNSALALGGLTPSTSSLTLVKKNTNLEVVAMVRPRAGGFCYLKEEFEQMLNEAKDLIINGTDALCFGFLTEDYEIDIEKTTKMVELCKENNIYYVFHRAFDILKDPYKGTEILINLGFKRILTSGQKAKAIDGKDLIKDLQDKYSQKIEFLAGSGVNETNAKELMEYTGISQIHTSAKDFFIDKTTSGKDVNYRYLDGDNIDFVSTERVKKILESIK